LPAEQWKRGGDGGLAGELLQELGVGLASLADEACGGLAHHGLGTAAAEDLGELLGRVLGHEPADVAASGGVGHREADVLGARREAIGAFLLDVGGGAEVEHAAQAVAGEDRDVGLARVAEMAAAQQAALRDAAAVGGRVAAEVAEVEDLLEAMIGGNAVLAHARVLLVRGSGTSRHVNSPGGAAGAASGRDLARRCPRPRRRRRGPRRQMYCRMLFG
jgi:hypothetical protein